MTNPLPQPAPVAQPRFTVTIALIAINVVVFVAMFVGGVSPLEPTTEGLIRWGASFGPRELSTEWWRLFTAMFVHIGVLHIALNMFCLLSLGTVTESLFGPWKYLALYVLSGVGGNIASVALHPMTVAAGASGAIFGVAGALLALQVRHIPALENLRGRGSRGGLGIVSFILYNLFYGFANTGIDNAAHIGGLVIGFIGGYLLPVVGSVDGRGTARTQGALLGTAVLLFAAFLGVRHARAGYSEVEQARQALVANDVGTGIAKLQRVLKSDPQNIQAHVLLGAAYFDQGKRAEALQEFQQAVRIDSTNVLALSSLGQAQFELQHWTEAAAAFQRAAQADSTNADWWANLGSSYLNAGRDSEAVAPLERATRLQPDTARNHYNLGLAYLRRQKFGAALVSFNRTLALRPDDPLVLLRRGSAYQLLGRFDSARADYRRVLNSPPGVASDQTLRDARRLLSELPSR